MFPGDWHSLTVCFRKAGLKLPDSCCCNSSVHCSTGPQQNVDDDYCACRVKAVGGYSYNRGPHIFFWTGPAKSLHWWLDIVSIICTQLNLGHLAPCGWEPVVISLNCLLLNMNSTNETLLFDRFLIMYNLCVFTCIIVMFVFHCTHVRMSYVLNSYLQRGRPDCVHLSSVGSDFRVSVSCTGTTIATRSPTEL